MAQRIRVWQIRIKLYMLRDISAEQMQTKLTAYIDKGFFREEDLAKFHRKIGYKNYCYDLPFPLEKDKLYKKGKIYTVTIRTIDERLARYFSEECVNTFTDDMKGLTYEMRTLPEKMIECLYSLTPTVLKDEKDGQGGGGYWRAHQKLSYFEGRLKTNLIKKWNAYMGQKLEEDFELYTMIEFLNDAPIAVKYKNITLLGDKIRLQIADNRTAQNLAYMSLGTGVCENNARGAGFVNYRWV